MQLQAKSLGYPMGPSARVGPLPSPAVSNQSGGKPRASYFVGSHVGSNPLKAEQGNQLRSSNKVEQCTSHGVEGHDERHKQSGFERLTF